MAKMIMLVDDSKEMLESLSRVLEYAGYTTRCFSSGALALEELSKTDYDLLITDICMPVMDGFEIISKCKSTKAALPIIMITGNREMNKLRIEQELKANAFACIDKPFDVWKLLSVVNSAVGR